MQLEKLQTFIPKKNNICTLFCCLLEATTNEEPAHREAIGKNSPAHIPSQKIKRIKQPLTANPFFSFRFRND